MKAIQIEYEGKNEFVQNPERVLMKKSTVKADIYIYGRYAGTVVFDKFETPLVLR